jgi:short-subunit dehydrogenase
MSPRFPALLFNPPPWTGKVAIVTGCTLGGIGAQTAAVLAGKAGLWVVVVGRTQTKLDECIESIHEE